MPKVTEIKKKPHTIAFSAVLNHSKISKTFYEYLKQENCFNNWDFILSTHVLISYMKKGNFQLVMVHMKYIIDIFFESETKKLQLNSDHSKEIILKILEHWKKQQFVETKDFLEYLKDILIEDYKNTVFQKFLLTTKAEKLIKKYAKEKNFIVPILTQKFEYKDEDFEMDHITETDFEFFEHIAEEKQFSEVLYKSENYSLQIMNKNYFPNVSFLKNPHLIRIEFIFDHSFQQTAFAVFHDFASHNRHFTFFKVINENLDGSVILEHHLVLLDSMIPHVRQSICQSKCDKNSLFMILKACKMKDLEFNKPTMIQVVTEKNENPHLVKSTQEFFFCSVQLTSIGSNKTKFVLNLTCDLGNQSHMIPRKFVKHIFTENYNSMKNNFKKLSGSETIYDMKPNTSGKFDPISKVIYESYVKQNGENEKVEIQKQKNSPIENLLLFSNILSNISTSNEVKFEDQILKDIAISESNKPKDTGETLNQFFEESTFDLTQCFSPKLNFDLPNELDNEIDFKMGDLDDLELNGEISEIDELISFLENEEKQTDEEIELL
eukprot:gene12193-5780_t